MQNGYSAAVVEIFLSFIILAPLCSHCTLLVNRTCSNVLFKVTIPSPFTEADSVWHRRANGYTACQYMILKSVSNYLVLQCFLALFLYFIIADKFHIMFYVKTTKGVKSDFLQ